MAGGLESMHATPTTRITLIICPEWIFHEFDEWTPDMRQEFRELGARTGVEIKIIELDHQVR